MPLMDEAATAKEVVDDETTHQSFPRLRASGLAGAPVSLPMPGAAQLLTHTSPVSLAVSPGVAGVWPAGMITYEHRSPSPEVCTVGCSFGSPRGGREERAQPREGMCGIDLARRGHEGG